MKNRRDLDPEGQSSPLPTETACSPSPLRSPVTSGIVSPFPLSLSASHRNLSPLAPKGTICRHVHPRACGEQKLARYDGTTANRECSPFRANRFLVVTTRYVRRPFPFFSFLQSEPQLSLSGYLPRAPLRNLLLKVGSLATFCFRCCFFCLLPFSVLTLCNTTWKIDINLNLRRANVNQFANY